MDKVKIIRINPTGADLPGVLCANLSFWLNLRRNGQNDGGT